MSRNRTVELVRRARITYSDQPATPAAPTASNITSTGVTVSWAMVPTATEYRLQRRLATGPGVWVEAYQGPALTADQTGLTSSTAYDFQVAALNGTAQSDWSPLLNVTTAGASAPPGTPSAPAVSDVSETTATLTVTAVSGATSYGWQRSATSGTTGFVTIAGTTTTITDTGLTGSTNYWYRVRASNADGDSAYSTATAVTTDAPPLLPPTKPATPVLASQTPTSNTIQLTAVATATSYQLQRSSTAPGTAPWTNVNIGPQLLVTDTGRTPGATVYYRYSASNAAGESPQSDTLSTTNPTTGANVQPVSALYIKSRSGVAVHPNFNTATDVYHEANANAVVARAASMGLSFIRGQLPADSVADSWATALRAHGMKWLMGLVPEGSTSPTDQTIAETKTKVQRVNSTYADICAGLEGINEPNHNRGGGVVPMDWAHTTFLHAQAIWQESRKVGSNISNVVVLGTSLHDVAADASYTDPTPSGGPRHYDQLVDEGILSVQTTAGLHTYPGGGYPIRQLDSRLQRIFDAFGANYPVWCTEWGYHNALNTSAGHKPASERAAGIWGPRGYLQFITTVKPDGITRGNIRLTYYEGLDDFDNNTLVNHEFHFGLYRVGQASAAASVNPATWIAKPIVGSLGSLLNRLDDPAGTTAYTPALVVCDVSSPSTGANLQWQVFATKAQSNAGEATVAVWRDKPDPWNRDTSTDITVAAVAVDIRDRVGTRRINVDANTTYLDLR